MRTLGVEVAVDAKADLGEGPTWDAVRGALSWVDIDACVVREWDPTTGALSQWDTGSPVGAALPMRSGRRLLALREGFAALDLESGVVEHMVDVERDASTRINDAKCDRAGRAWGGTVAPGSLYRLDPDRQLSCMLTDVALSNGLAWSADDKTMYFIDTMAGLDAFDYDIDDGSIRNRRRLVPTVGDELPDGMCIDVDDCLWVAFFRPGVVRRYTPAGQLEAEVRVPSPQVTSCAFGGPDLDQLFITTGRIGLSAEQLARHPAAGAVFVCEPGVSGLAADAFAG